MYLICKNTSCLAEKSYFVKQSLSNSPQNKLDNFLSLVVLSDLLQVT